MEDSEHDCSFNEFLLNDLPSMSDEDTDKQRHVSDNDEGSAPVLTVSPMISTNNIPNPEGLEGIAPQSDVQNLRSYLQKQCYDGCKWTSSLTFEGSLDKNTFEVMDVL